MLTNFKVIKLVFMIANCMKSETKSNKFLLYLNHKSRTNKKTEIFMINKVVKT